MTKPLKASGFLGLTVMMTVGMYHPITGGYSTEMLP